MWRTAVAVIAGPLLWFAIATVLNFGLRALIPGYHHAEPAMAFTLAMQIGRLALAVATSLATGALVRMIAPPSRLAPIIVGALMLALFVPMHIQIWPHFPVWYHLFFLITLAPLVIAGAQLAHMRRAEVTA
jgi:hypothetical protein